MHRIALALLLLLACAFPVGATDYHMTTSSGSFASLIPSLTPGDRLIIHAGTYSESISSNHFAIPNGTSWSNPITIMGAPGETVILTPGSDHIINLVAGNCGGPSETKYLIFKNLVTDAQFSSQKLNVGGCGNGVHHIRFEDVEMRNDLASCFDASDCYHDSEFVRVNVHHCGSSFLDHGMYVCGQRQVIRDSEIHDIPYGFGIHVFDQNIEGCADSTQILNNKIHDNANGMTVNRAPNALIANNLIYNHTQSGGWALQTDRNSNNAHIYNNTFYNNLNNVNPWRVSGNSISNNIFSQVGSVVVEDSATGTNYQNNLCTSSGTGCTTIGNPMLTNPGGANFTLQSGSAARNAGVTLSQVPTDYAGVARPQGFAYDIGAYEYVEGGGVPPSGNPIYVSTGGHGAEVPTDLGDCSVPENILTPRATLVAALTCMTVPGKTLYLRGGTYTGVIDTGGGIPIAGGSSPATPTRIEAYGSETVILALPVGGQTALYVRDVSNLTVSKLIVDAIGRAGSNAFACSNSDHITLQNSTFRNSYYEPGYFVNCSNVTVTQSIFHTSQVAPVVSLEGTMNAVTFDQVELHTGPVQGLNANATNGTNTSLVVTRTQFHNTGTGAGGHALDLGAGTGALVVNNIIDHNNAGIRVRNGAGGAKVYHNAIASNTGTAMQCDAGATSVTFANNISFGNGTNAVVNSCGATLATNLDTGVDPLWTNVAARNFIPGPTSPAIDMISTGLPEAMFAIDGTARPVGLLFDAGPYEQTKSVVPGDPTPPPARLISRWLGMLY